jgi:acetate kinase
MKILVLNSGSSSLKYQLIDAHTEEVVAKGLAECVGIACRCGRIIQETKLAGKIAFDAEMNDHDEAMNRVFALLTDPDKGVVSSVDEIAAVGHRVVHGGEKFAQPTLITDDVLAEIEKMSELAPLHNPPNLAGIRACMRLMPGVPQVAVFDTAFHATIPDYAYMYALPYDYYTTYGVRRYGFHGTSHQYVTGIALDMLAKAGIAPQDSRIVTCHLGNGCSMTAIAGGRVVDTSMGLTPAEGLVMGTRSGDLDPAILVYLSRRLHAPAAEIDRIINKESGLLGISGLSSDMRDIEDAAAKGNPRAELALGVFCYRIRKYVGAYAAAMGGLDAIVFTAGIGENSPVVRERVCRDLAFLGVELDGAKNVAERGRAVDLATPSSRVRVLLVPTNEERMIARETARVIAGAAAPSPIGMAG